MVVETRKSKASRPSPATSSQRKTTKRSKVKIGDQPSSIFLNNPVNDTGSDSGDEGFVTPNPAGEFAAEPKFPWAKLISQYPEKPHRVITSAVFTVGNHGDLVIPDLFMYGQGDLCELTQMKHGGPSVATLKIKGSGVGPVVVNGKPYEKGTCVNLQGGDEVVFSTPWKHAYIFQPLKYENLVANLLSTGFLIITMLYHFTENEFEKKKLLLDVKSYRCFFDD